MGDSEAERKARRRFTAEYKETLLRRLDACQGRGEASALLRDEGLYWSHVAKWRRQKDEGSLEDSWTEPAIRSRIDLLVDERLELIREIETLEKQNERLRERLVALEPEVEQKR